MSVTEFIQTPWSLLPPVLALVLALTTRRVLLSLGAGIVAGILLLNNLQPGQSLVALGESALGLVWSDGEANSWNLQLIGFLLLLGAMTALMSASGATGAFAEWAAKRVKNRRGAQLTAVLLGIAVFIDDYFNSLAVGTVSRPLTDRHQVSRARLAYLLDSTAAPMCVITPISSWGAYIIAVIGGILVSHGLTEHSPLASFVAMIPMNYYALLALLLVVLVALFDINIGPMRRHEAAAQAGQLFDTSKGQPAGAEVEVHPEARGVVAGLLAPLGVMLVMTVAAMIQTGAAALAADGASFSLLGAFENTNVSLSLVLGGLAGVVTAAVYALRSGLRVNDLVPYFVKGLSSMLPAIYVLLMAWALADVIGSLETGKFLAAQLGEHISATWLPALLFLLAGLMAFATGTSWGTFGIMLPIAGDMAMATDVAMMLPMLSAVLAGAVFGDHCSPISDTTILSSTGAGCHHLDHVFTQLPYALMVAGLSLVAYLVEGVSGSVALGLFTGAALLVAIVGLLRRAKRQGEAAPAL